MRMRVLVACGVLAGVVGGCAVAKSWVPISGSRADATVTLGYQYGPFESPTVDEGAAQSLAEQRCAVWGYTGATSFGVGMTQCTMPGGSMCQQFTVTRQYQCTGTGTPGQSAWLEMPTVGSGSH